MNYQTSPYSAFDIQYCDTYEHLWTYDLEISCGNTTDYHDCHCTFAEILMQDGELSCDDALTCPAGCPICSNCLLLLGCDVAASGEALYAGSTGNSTVAAAAAIFTPAGPGLLLASLTLGKWLWHSFSRNPPVILTPIYCRWRRNGGANRNRGGEPL